MPVLPVVTRELAVQSRRRSTYWVRVLASLVAGFLMLWLLVITTAAVPGMSQGRALFGVLSLLSFVYCLFTGALVTSDCLSAEKRDGTIGLLFLTDLKGYDVVFGKLASSSLHAIYGLMATVPMMSLALLFGGVSGSEIGRTVLLLGNTLFLSLSAGMFVSTISRDERKAVFGTLFVMLLLTAGPYPLGYYLHLNGLLGESGIETKEMIFSVSPIYAYQLISTPMWLPKFSDSLLTMHLAGWVLLAMACLVVPRVCRDRPAGRQRLNWTERWRRVSRGSGATRLARRRRLLDRNACLWLCSQHRNGTVWVLIVPMVILAGWIYFWYFQMFFEAALLLLFITAVLLKLWFVAEVCTRWMEDRRNGALELLLCTSLSERDLVRGQRLALQRQFGWAIFVLLGAGLLLLAGAYFGTWQDWAVYRGRREWLLAMIPVFFADFIALRWVGTWQALTARGLNRAIWGTIARVLMLRWIVYALLAGAAFVWTWIAVRRIGFFSNVSVWLIIALTFDVMFILSTRRRVLRYFRAVAVDPVGYKIVEAVPVPAGVRTGERGLDEAEAAVAAKPRFLSRRLRYALIAAVVLVATPFIYRYTLNRKLDGMLSRWQARGKPVSLEQIDSKRPPLDDANNAAVILERLAPVLLNPNQMGPQISAQLRQGLLGTSGQMLSPTARHAMTTLLSSNAVALKTIHEGPSLANARYIMDPRASSAIKINQQFQALIAVTQILECEAAIRIYDDDFEGAIKSVGRMLELTRSLEGQQQSYLNYVRGNLFDATVRTLELLVSRASVSDTQLAMWQKQFIEADRADFADELLTVFVCTIGEWRRASGSHTVVHPTGAVAGMGAMPARGFLGSLEIVRLHAQARLFQWSGASERGFIELLRAVESVTAEGKAPISMAERLRRADQAFGLVQSPGPQTSWQVNLSRSVVDLLAVAAELLARCRVVVCGLAIQRYRQQNEGSLPEKLDDLVPTFLPSVPVDPFDDQPLRYRRSTSGWAVYSVGRNRVDDGGAGGNPMTWPSIGGSGHVDVVFAVGR